MAGRIHTYKLAVGAVLALLVLGTLAGLFLLQLLTLPRPGEEVEVHVRVEREGAALHNGTLVVRDATALSALQEAGRQGGFAVEVRSYPGSGSYVVRIGEWAAEGAHGWLYCLGEDPCTHPPAPADRYALQSGDRLRWHWGQPEDGL